MQILDKHDKARDELEKAVEPIFDKYQLNQLTLVMVDKEFTMSSFSFHEPQPVPAGMEDPELIELIPLKADVFILKKAMEQLEEFINKRISSKMN